MKIAKLFRVVLTGLAVFAATNLWAQDGGQGRAGGRGNGTEAILKQLDLSDEQSEQIKALMEESGEARKAILAKHGIVMAAGERPDREKMKEAQPEIAQLRKATDAKVVAVLSEDQLVKFNELRAQGRQKGGEQGGNNQKKGKKAAAE